MPATSISTKEEKFYGIFLDKAIGYADGNVEGIQFRQLVSAAGVVAKQRQTRGAMHALRYQIARDHKKGILPPNFQIDSKS